MNTTTENSIKEPIGRSMSKISKMFLSNLQENLEHLDIQRSFYPLLLIESGNGTLTQQELAHKLSCDKVQVVRIIDHLSSNGYVQRIQNMNDKRKYELTITEKAKQVIPDIQKAIQETSAIALNGLSQNQIEELYTMITLIENNLLSHKRLSAK